MGFIEEFQKRNYKEAYKQAEEAYKSDSMFASYKGKAKRVPLIIMVRCKKEQREYQKAIELCRLALSHYPDFEVYSDPNPIEGLVDSTFSGLLLKCYSEQMDPLVEELINMSKIGKFIESSSNETCDHVLKIMQQAIQSIKQDNLHSYYRHSGQEFLNHAAIACLHARRYQKALELVYQSFSDLEDLVKNAHSMVESLFAHDSDNDDHDDDDHDDDSDAYDADKEILAKPSMRGLWGEEGCEIYTLDVDSSSRFPCGVQHILFVCECLHNLQDKARMQKCVELFEWIVSNESTLPSSKNHSALLNKIKTLLTQIKTGVIKVKVEDPLGKEIQIPEKEIRLTDRIGDTSGFGVVYTAKWKNQTVAVKQIKVNTSSAAAMAAGRIDPTLDSFRNEAKIMLGCEHENIIKFFFFFIGDNKFSIVMEYCPIGSLRHVLDDNGKYPDATLTWAIKIQLAHGASEGIQYLHHKNIVHSDIKSANVLVKSGFFAVICDFGLAKQREHFTSTATSSTPGGGTLLYNAPEIFDGEPNTRKSDVYSLAMVLWEIATRLWPYAGLNVAGIMMRVVTNQRPDISGFQAEQPRYARLIERCWHGVSANRPEIAEVVTELAQCRP